MDYCTIYAQHEPRLTVEPHTSLCPCVCLQLRPVYQTLAVALFQLGLWLCAAREGKGSSVGIIQGSSNTGRGDGSGRGGGGWSSGMSVVLLALLGTLVMDVRCRVAFQRHLRMSCQS